MNSLALRMERVVSWKNGDGSELSINNKCCVAFHMCRHLLRLYGRLLSNAVMLNHVAYITAALCPIGKARHALQRIRQFPDDWQLLRLWHQWLCEVASCVFYVIHEGTLRSPILSHSSCR